MKVIKNSNPKGVIEVDLGVLPKGITIDKFIEDFEQSDYPHTQEGVDDFIKDLYGKPNTLIGLKVKYKSKSINYE